MAPLCFEEKTGPFFLTSKGSHKESFGWHLSSNLISLQKTPSPAEREAGIMVGCWKGTATDGAEQTHVDLVH